MLFLLEQVMFLRPKSLRTSSAFVLAVALISPPLASATEGALGRQITGTTVQPNIGIVSPEPITAVNLSQIYLDGKIRGSREVPVGSNTTLGLDGQVAFTLATLMKVWDTGVGRGNFASSITLPYIWTKVDATLTGPRGRSGGNSDTASNLFDIYITPVIAGYHFSQTQHMALSLNIWAPTGKYDQNSLANPSLNNWTFVPQAAYTGVFPESGFQIDAGTQQQLGSDKGPTADRLNGFKGNDWAVGPIVTYDRKLADSRSLSLGLRWVPTVSSQRRLDSTSTVMASATLIF